MKLLENKKKYVRLIGMISLSESLAYYWNKNIRINNK